MACGAQLLQATIEACPDTAEEVLSDLFAMLRKLRAAKDLKELQQ